MATNNAVNRPKISFNAYLNPTVTDVTGDSTVYTVIFNTELFDIGGGYNNGTGVFTAPVTGKYNFSTTVSLGDIAAAHTFGLVSIVTTGGEYYLNAGNYAAMRTLTPNDTYIINGSVTCAMTAGDLAVVRVVVYNGTKVVNVTGSATIVTYFSGYLIE
jgi:hypothetical protein